MRNTYRGERVINVRVQENAFDVLTEIALREHRPVAKVASDGLTKYARYISSGQVEKMAYRKTPEQVAEDSFLDPSTNPFLPTEFTLSFDEGEVRAILDALQYGGPGNEELIKRLEKILVKEAQE